MTRYPLSLDNDAGTAGRLLAFRREHPEWVITFDAIRDVWRGWRESADVSEEHVRYWLDRLLDRLEAIEAGS